MSRSWFSTKVTACARVDTGEPAVVELRHVKEARAIAHRREQVKSEREVERVTTALGSTLDPALDTGEVAIEEFANDEFARQLARMEEVADKICRDPLDVVAPITLDAKRRVIQSALDFKPPET